MTIAPLDRRVLVHIDSEPAEALLSSLRDEPFLVLVGEPGLGKSTALEHEAYGEGMPVLTCRDVMNGTPLPQSGTVYLDALDEYRSGENGKDKLVQLANALNAGKVARWRLTCRAEDWRDAADLKAMNRAAEHGRIVVAHLLPLCADEALAVLAALGADDSRSFYDQALACGAAAFLESPLSLRLLHTVVMADGIWPESRFELYERAIHALAHEHDPERVTDSRPGVDAIIETASKLCFYALASGARAIWRANAMAPGKAEYLSLNSLNLPSGLTGAALDTALFRGEGHAFVAFHRTVAEFLAARFLARTTVGADTGPSFPLRRAAALILGRDRQAPSELRGLYAWFAAHLHQSGDDQGALRLIERDAATVLAYGDAAAFDTAGRKAILVNLDREDPYFLASQDEATVLGGLAGEDLVATFADILDDDTRSHVQRTVMQALSDGPTVTGIQGKLGDIVLDPHRPLWLRERAAEVHVKSAADPAAMWRSLMDELASQALAAGQVMLRAALMANARGDELEASDIRRLLADFAALPTDPDDDDIEDRGALTSLAWALRSAGPRNLFDTPIAANAGVPRRQRSQIRSFIDQALASTILRNPAVSADRLWRWVSNAREHVWDMLDSSVVEAIQGWIDRDPDQCETDLFLAVAATDTEHDRPWVIVNHFSSTVRRRPTSTLIEGLLELAGQETQRQPRQRLLRLAAYAARSPALWPDWQDRVVAILEREPGNIRFIKDLLADSNAKYKKEEAKRLARIETSNAAARKNNIADMTPRLAAISGGDAFGTLAWAANHYRNAMISDKKAPLAKVTEYTNEEIASAIAEGLVQFAIHIDMKVGAEDLGRAEAKNGAYTQEYVVAAGLHQALLHGRAGELAEAPLVRALVGLRQDYFGGDGGKLLSRWSSHRLAADPAAGTDLLLRYWNSALDAGDGDLDGLDKLIAHGELDLVEASLAKLLELRPDLPEPALRQALVAATQVFSDEKMIRLAHAYHDMGNLGRDQQDIWSFVALALDPEGYRPRIPEDRIEAVLLAPNGQLSQALIDRCGQQDRLDLIRVGGLGKLHAAKDDDWRGSDRPSAIVRAAIKRLSASKTVEAGNELKAIARQVHPSWAATIAHAAAEHARMIRDDLFVAPTASELMAMLAGGPPATPADLNAVVLEELERYRSTLRTGSEMPWKRFWNTDQDGSATNPQIENEDRDRLLELLRIRLEKYHIVASLTEARRGENTRADVLLLSHAGKNLPIEAKRHYNRELWSAPLEQLGGYAADEGAHGFGVYLVFWFGSEFHTPARKDGVAVPNTAESLEDALIQDIPVHLRDKLSVVVFDVSRPPEMIAAVGRRAQARMRKKKPEA
ncbi:hypothetical protein [Mesorhizobium sp.]|uniref:hypothetical protein n=1 Tax=Mesorhizobium sp. TaxID=1871066 RepID=UPI000FE6E8EE|nr:hypothetical protein [Mesorhizobium sp.]RWC39820.1 MAG: hypothetical protein EOS28_25220 [Mesorhizobium sp.]RWF02132.1 MAG: hypothetical protein EOS68_06895 [Mesorhizobium sp.]